MGTDKYKCQCCGKPLDRLEERDRGSWCMECFPLTALLWGGCGPDCKGLPHNRGESK